MGRERFENCFKQPENYFDSLVGRGTVDNHSGQGTNSLLLHHVVVDEIGQRQGKQKVAPSQPLLCGSSRFVIFGG